MRIEQRGNLTTRVQANSDVVRAVLADPDEIVKFVAPLVDNSSSSTRWVVTPVRVGPVMLRPMADMTHRVSVDRVLVVGVPVPKATPTWVDVELVVRSAGDHSDVVTTWHVRVDLPGPQFVARLASPLLESQTRFVSRELSRGVVDRFR